MHKLKEKEDSTDSQKKEIYGCGTDKALKSLEESKNEARQRISLFWEKAKLAVENALKDVTERLEEVHKTNLESISYILEKAQESHELTEELENGALNVLRWNIVSYDIKDNSDFGFGLVKKYAKESVCCRSLEALLASLPRDDMLAVTRELKKCTLSACKESTKRKQTNSHIFL